MGMFSKSSTAVETAPPPANNRDTSLLGRHKSTSSRPSTETERHGIFSKKRTSLDESRSGHHAGATGAGAGGLHLFSERDWLTAAKTKLKAAQQAEAAADAALVRARHAVKDAHAEIVRLEKEAEAEAKAAHEKQKAPVACASEQLCFDKVVEMSEMDPFAARGTNSVPPGIHDSDLFAATPRSPPTAPTSTSGAGGTRSIPLLSAAGTTAGRTGRSTSGRSVKTPWYLTWAGIVGLIAALLLAIGLGVGLGVGLGAKDDGGDPKSNAAMANGAGGGGTSTVTSQSIESSIVTADGSTTIVHVSVAGRPDSFETRTTYIGGSTVLISAPVAGNGGAAPVVTVSETLPPSTRVQTVYRTTFESTQTVTVTQPGGAARTTTEVVTVKRTVTADARRR